MEQIIILGFGLVAVLIGAWRQSCEVYELAAPSKCPKIWMNKTVRVLTWIVTAILSLIFAIEVSRWVRTNVGELIGNFSFGALLAARWIASMMIGSFPANEKCRKNSVAPY